MPQDDPMDLFYQKSTIEGEDKIAKPMSQNEDEDISVPSLPTADEVEDEDSPMLKLPPADDPEQEVEDISRQESPIAEDDGIRTDLLETAKSSLKLLEDQDDKTMGYVESEEPSSDLMDVDGVSIYKNDDNTKGRWICQMNLPKEIQMLGGS